MFPELALHRAVSYYGAHNPTIPQKPYHAIPRLSDTGHCPNLSDPLSHHLQPKKPSFEFLCMMRETAWAQSSLQNLCRGRSGGWKLGLSGST